MEFSFALSAINSFLNILRVSIVAMQGVALNEKCHTNDPPKCVHEL